MGQEHNELRRGTTSDAFKKSEGDSRSDSGISRYSETLTPVKDLWSESQPEFRFLREEGSAFVGSDISAGAATTLATSALVNPSTSKELIVPLRFQAYVDVAAQVILTVSTQAAIEAALGVSIVGSALDTRWRDRAGTFAPVGVVRTGNPVGVIAGSIISRLVFLVNTTRELIEARDVVLSPGWGLVMVLNDDAAAFHFSMTWRERKAFRTELVQP